jgi:hypothetical protein
MARREELEPLQGALAQALGGLAERGRPRALEAVWLAAAGTAAAGSSRPVSFARGKLIVEVDAPAWLNALVPQHAELTERLGRQLVGFEALELRLRGAR